MGRKWWGAWGREGSKRPHFQAGRTRSIGTSKPREGSWVACSGAAWRRSEPLFLLEPAARLQPFAEVIEGLVVPLPFWPLFLCGRGFLMQFQACLVTLL